MTDGGLALLLVVMTGGGRGGGVGVVFYLNCAPVFNPNALGCSGPHDTACLRIFGVYVLTAQLFTKSRVYPT